MHGHTFIKTMSRFNLSRTPAAWSCSSGQTRFRRRNPATTSMPTVSRQVFRATGCLCKTLTNMQINWYAFLFLRISDSFSLTLVSRFFELNLSRSHFLSEKHTTTILHTALKQFHMLRRDWRGDRALIHCHSRPYSRHSRRLLVIMET